MSLLWERRIFSRLCRDLKLCIRAAFYCRNATQMCRESLAFLFGRRCRHRKFSKIIKQCRMRFYFWNFCLILWWMKKFRKMKMRMICFREIILRKLFMLNFWPNWCIIIINSRSDWLSSELLQRLLKKWSLIVFDFFFIYNNN